MLSMGHEMLILACTATLRYGHCYYLHITGESTKVVERILV